MNSARYDLPHHETSRQFNHACYHGLFDEALDLLSRGADPLWQGASGKSGLHFAAMAGRAELCSFLAQQHPDSLVSRDQAGMTPLHLACRNSRFDAAMVLRAHGASVEARDDFGRRPADCCSDQALLLALTDFDDDLFSPCLATKALAHAMSAPSIRSFL